MANEINVIFGSSRIKSRQDIFPIANLDLGFLAILKFKAVRPPARPVVAE
jgi:hypothetical protein